MYRQMVDVYYVYSKQYMYSINSDNLSILKARWLKMFQVENLQNN